MKVPAPNIHPFAANGHFSLYYRPFFNLSSYFSSKWLGGTPILSTGIFTWFLSYRSGIEWKHNDEALSLPTTHRMRFVNAKNLLTLQSLLLFLLIVVVALGIALPYIVPPRTAANTTEFITTEVSLATPVPTSLATRWEYLTVIYAQSTNLADNPNNDLYELVTADQEPYASQFSAILYEGCDGLDNFIYEEINCLSGNFKGREYFLNLIGQDGWELIQIDNYISQYTYKIDILFKRPTRP